MDTPPDKMAYQLRPTSPWVYTVYTGWSGSRVKGQVKEDDLINNFVKIVIIIIVYICLLFLFIIIEAHIYQRKVSVVNILSLIMCSKVILKLVSYFNSKPKTKPRTQN